MRAVLATVSALCLGVVGVVAASAVSAAPPEPVVFYANDFTSGDLSGWSRSGGTWTVVDGVYRQSGTGSDAKSWVPATWFSYVATARIRPVTLASASAFVSFDVGVRGATTSYRLALTGNQDARLQLVQGGRVTEIGRAPMTVVAGTWYTVSIRFLPVGISATVNGRQVPEGGSAIPAGGHLSGGVGFTAARAAGDLDDVRVVHEGPVIEPPCCTPPPSTPAAPAPPR